MATSWSTGRQHLNQDSEHNSLQTVNQQAGRPIPIGVADPLDELPTPGLCNTPVRITL